MWSARLLKNCTHFQRMTVQKPRCSSPRSFQKYSKPRPQTSPLASEVRQLRGTARHWRPMCTPLIAEDRIGGLNGGMLAGVVCVMGGINGGVSCGRAYPAFGYCCHCCSLSWCLACSASWRWVPGATHMRSIDIRSGTMKSPASANHWSMVSAM